MKETLWPELEKLGEAEVRERLAMQLYRGRARFYAEEWLRFREYSRAKGARRPPGSRPGSFAERAAIVAAGAMAAAAFVAHWSLLD